MPPKIDRHNSPLPFGIFEYSPSIQSQRHWTFKYHLGIIGIHHSILNLCHCAHVLLIPLWDAPSSMPESNLLSHSLLLSPLNIFQSSVVEPHLTFSLIRNLWDSGQRHSWKTLLCSLGWLYSWYSWSTYSLKTGCIGLQLSLWEKP